jgi:hypothetical protein
MIRFHNQHFSAATLCNLASINPGALNRRIADIYLNADFPPAKAPAGADFPPAKAPAEEFPQPPPERLASIAGVYVGPDDGDRIPRLHLVDGKLWGGGLTSKGRELKAIGAGAFRFAGSAAVLDIADGGNGTPQALTLRGGGVTTPLRFTRAYPTDSADGAAWTREFAGEFRSDEVEMPNETTIEGDRLILRSLKTNQTMLPVEPGLLASDDFRMRSAA